MIRCKPKMCFKIIFPILNTTLREFTLDEKQFHMPQNLASKHNERTAHKNC